MDYRILVIDDEKDIRELLAQTLELEDYQVYTAANGKSGKKILEAQEIHVALTDIKLPDINGIILIEELKNLSPSTEIICLTAFGNIQDGVTAMKKGAFDYLVKGDDNPKILPLVAQAAEKARLQFRIRHLEKKVSKQYGFENIIGKSKVIQQAIALSQKVAPSDTTVLLTGATGTGKEVFAHAIHAESPCKNESFVALNCSAFGKELLESEMFGHKAGAFTGAGRDKKGLIEEAHQGTLFLDEIGELQMELQAKLLRVLESGAFFKVGDTKETTVNVRIIAATNRNLEYEIQQGNFREDLFYRLSAFTIRLPCLDERKEDIPLLAEYFRQQFALRMQKKIRSFHPDFLHALQAHSWKGNIRELRNIIERAVILSEEEQLTPELLPFNFQHGGAQSVSGGIFRLQEVEKSHIQQVLHYTQGNKTKTAELLDIGLTTLYRKIKEYELE